MVAAFILFAKHLALLMLLLVNIAAMGTLVAGSRLTLVFRSIIGLAVWGHALLFLALIGQLRETTIGGVALAAIIGAVWRTRRARVSTREVSWSFPSVALAVAGGAWFALAFLLALRPPLAFDETLYHLPFVRALATSGQLRFVYDTRFGAMPQLHELLCVPMFWFGDVATHLVSLAEAALTAALLIEWGRLHESRAGWLAAAFFLGSPLIVQLATISHVDCALILFVAAGFYCLDRLRMSSSDHSRWAVWAGLLFGTACAVKYLGAYFAAAALLSIVWLDRRRAIVFTASCLVSAVPTTLWLVAVTGNPVFPFAHQVFGETAWSFALPEVAPGTRVMRTLMLIWNVTFDRQHVGDQPHVTPLLIVAIIAVVLAARRDFPSRVVVILSATYVIVFAFLPQDSRYLSPLLPLLGIAAAVAIGRRWPRLTTVLALITIAPGIAYIAYRLAIGGLPPATAMGRQAMLERMIPEFRALTRAGDGRVYACGAEQLKYHARGGLLGDSFGPYSYDRILGNAADTSSIAARLRRIDAPFFLTDKHACVPPRANGGMDLVYEDAGAQLWRVQSSPARR